MTAADRDGDRNRTGLGPTDLDRLDVDEPELAELLDAVTSPGRPRRRPERSWLTRVLWALAAVPAAAIALLLSMAIRVRLAEGAWPARNDPDPKELGLHNTLTVLLIVASVVSVVVVPVLALLGAVRGHRRLPVGPLVTAAVGFVVLVLVLRADVGGLGAWIAD